MVKKIDGGYVPPKKPAKPAGGGQRGFVPPRVPVKPPQNSGTGKK
jgi:hypothetical protein